MIKKILTTILTATLFWSLAQSALAVVQLNDSFRPNSLPSFDSVEAVDPDHPETAATQTVILFVGNIISKVLLFTASIAIIFVIIAGANYIFAFGKDQRLEIGKRGLTWSIVGLVMILLSYAIVQGIISILLQVDSKVQ